jgi:hypothetical protein
MAYTGFGVWALVGQQISNQLFVTMILWFTVKWRPQATFLTGQSEKTIFIWMEVIDVGFD